MSRAEASHQALTQFMPYVASMLASLAGLPAVQIKAVSRLVALALDGAVWTVCASALVQPLLTLAAMSNPMSSFRVEFHRMGGLAAIGLAYLEAQEEVRQMDSRALCPIAYALLFCRSASVCSSRC